MVILANEWDCAKCNQKTYIIRLQTWLWLCMFMQIFYISAQLIGSTMVPGDCGSNPSREVKFSAFIFGSQSHDCRLPSNLLMII